METVDEGLAQRLRESASIAPPELPEDAWAPVRENVQREQGLLDRMRAMPTTLRAVVLVVLVVAVGVGVLLATPRPDLDVFPLDRLLMALGLLGVGVLAGLWVALRPAYRPFRSGPAMAAVLVAVAIPVVLSLLPPAHEAHPASLEGVGDDFAKRAIACFIFGAVCALPVVSAGWVLVRKGLRRGWLVAASLVAAAGAGNLALLLHCPLTAVMHRAAGHGTVALAFGLVGVGVAWVLRRK